MDRLPPVDEQEWLLDCLRLLVRRRGAGPFLVAPILRARDLRALWSPTVAGVEAVARRLLDHAAVDHVELRVEPSAGGAPANALYHAGTPIWLADHDAGAITIGCEPAALTDLPTAVGLLAHEVAHAWRSQQELEVVEPDTEERLTDLSAVYLGFGLLSLGLAQRVRRQRAAWALVAPWSAAGIGTLSPEALAWLLGAQLVARRSGCIATWRVVRQLEAEPRRSLVEAVRALRQVPGGMDFRLGLPREGRAVPRLRSRSRSSMADVTGGDRSTVAEDRPNE